MALAEEHIEAIHSAMEAANGNIRIAVEFINELGWNWTQTRLYAAINQNTPLRVRWGSQSELVTSPPSIELTEAKRPQHIQDQESAELALKRQEEGLRSTLVKLGRSREEIDVTLAARDLQAKYALQTLAMVGGGTAEIAMWIKDDIAAIRSELNGDDPIDHEREKMLREDRSNLAGAFINCSDRLTKSVMVQMEAKRRMQEQQSKEKKKAQPRSLGITAQPGSRVNVLMEK